MTEPTAASLAALASARQELKRVLELASETSTLAEMKSLSEATNAKYKVMKSEFFSDRASQGIVDLYRVKCDEQGNSVPPGTDEMPDGLGQMIKMWKKTEDPNVVKVVVLPFEQYPDVYELKWTVEILEDIMADQ